MTVCELATCRPAARAPRAWRELALLALLYVGYSAARLVGDADLGTATGHAWTLLRVEELLVLDVELWANRTLHAVPGLAVVASYWYASLHYLVTPVVLVWAYRARPSHYRLVRDALVLGSAVGLVGFTLLPMAPPRMLPGFVDTLAATSAYGWWGADASAPEGLGSLTNELAAMPSLHVGWAFWCAWVVLRLVRNRWVRQGAVGYAVVTALVVVVTANHYVLDAVAGVAVMVVGMQVARRLRPTVGLPFRPSLRRRHALLAEDPGRTGPEDTTGDALAA